MASYWIESHTTLLRHKKLRAFAKALRLRPAYAMGHLHALWHVALEQQEDGDLSSWSDELIADASDFPGDASQYVRLLQEHGWFDGKLIHDWLDYAGNFLRGKYAKRNRERLVSIWSIHGRSYGTSSECQVNAKQMPTTPLPTSTYQPTDTPKGGVVPEKGKSEEPPPDPFPPGDSLDSEIKAFIGGHKFIMWDIKTHAKCRQLVIAVGWEKARAWIDEAVKNGSPFPVGWALGKARNSEEGKAAMDKPAPKRVPAIRIPTIVGRR